MQDIISGLTARSLPGCKRRFVDDDWEFSTGEVLRGHRWFPDIEDCGSVLARGISSGPDQDVEKVRLVYLGALSCAQKSVLIVTPYFLPDSALISALNTAALRGVRVDVVLRRVKRSPSGSLGGGSAVARKCWNTVAESG